MTELSIMIEGQMGVTWPIWQKLVDEVEALGCAGMFRSDHYTNASGPDSDSLEMIVSQVYLADHTKRIHFGPMVAPLSFREPTMLARQAAAIDDLSGGRFILGLGAGWQAREHELFGHTLGDIKERLDRFEEGLEVVTQLLSSDEPVTFEGKYFNLRGATLLPRPQRKGGPTILIGGNGPKRTLPLVAKYATMWNCIALGAERFREQNAMLDDLLKEAGRKPQDVKRSMMVQVIYGRDRAELEDVFTRPPFNGPRVPQGSLEDKIRYFHDELHALVGTGDDIAEQIAALAEAGVQEVMTQWFAVEDIDRLRAYAEDVLPKIK